MIRIATVQDAEQLEILNNEFNGEGETTLDNIRSSLANNKQEVIVVDEQNGELTGFVCVQLKKSFKIVDATYTILQAEDLSEDMALWQKIAETDVVNDIYQMYDYVNFLCAWNTYYVNSGTDESGNVVPGYFLYPTDALGLITTEGAQYNYGYKEGYFDAIVAKIETVDPVAFQDLVANIRSAEALAQKAFEELKNENYTSEKKYLEQFGTEDFVYTLNIGEELQSELQTLYYAFANWLSSWEL